MQRHERAIKSLPGLLWISDFTDSECRLSDVDKAISADVWDLVLVDHADDLISKWSNDLAVTRHSLRAVYLGLKKIAAKYQVPIWTGSQSLEMSWRMDGASIGDLAEAKVGKATGAAIVLVLTGGRREHPGLMYANIAKARRAYTERSILLTYDDKICRIW